MEFVVLGLLMLRSMTIYEINQAFKGSISMFYSASYGSLQSAIKKLLKQECINSNEKVENGRNKKIYSINQTGQERFFQWLFTPPNPKKLETEALAKISFLGLTQSNQDKRTILQNILNVLEDDIAQMTQTQTELNQLQSQLPPDFLPVFRYQIKPLDYGFKSNQMAMQWIQSLIDELEN